MLDRHFTLLLASLLGTVIGVGILLAFTLGPDVKPSHETLATSSITHPEADPSELYVKPLTNLSVKVEPADGEMMIEFQPDAEVKIDRAQASLDELEKQLSQPNWAGTASTGSGDRFAERPSVIKDEDNVNVGVIVSVDPDGGVALNGKGIPLNQLKKRLQSEQDRNADKGLSVVIRGAGEGVGRVLKALGPDKTEEGSSIWDSTRKSQP